jgi:secreted PhoX family phosphatase
MENGTTLKDPSLDLCNGTYPSEKNRLERRQLIAVKSGSDYSFLSTEVVRYSSASAASAAQKELQKALSNCQLNKGYKDTTGTLVPYAFKVFANIPTGLVAEGNRVLVYAEIDSAENKRTMLGFYQFNGEIFTGLYVMNSKGFTDAQVAKWLKVAATMADRLVGESV